MTTTQLITENEGYLAMCKNLDRDAKECMEKSKAEVALRQAKYHLRLAEVHLRNATQR
jgi:hypothetical protein